MIKFYEKRVVIFKERQQDSLGKFDLQDLDSAAEGRSRIDGRRINNYVEIINHRPTNSQDTKLFYASLQGCSPFQIPRIPLF